MLHSVTVSWSNIHDHGSLWYQHLKLRKLLFVDQMRWKIPHNDDVEWDQYDTANSRYVITHSKGVAVAASRLNPCHQETSLGSYMIRDAVLGRLEGIPSDILSVADLPGDARVWEATRFTVDPSLSAEQRNEALSINARDLAQAAKALNASSLIALMPPAYIRWLTSIDLPTNRLGPTKRDADGGRICVMQMDLNF